jgi:hypothetical protein
MRRQSARLAGIGSTKTAAICTQDIHPNWLEPMAAIGQLSPIQPVDNERSIRHFARAIWHYSATIFPDSPTTFTGTFAGTFDPGMGIKARVGTFSC